MKHLMILMIVLCGCLTDPDYGMTTQAAMDGPRVGISRERHCELIREAWQQIEDEKRSFNGCYRRFCAEWVAMLRDEQEQLEDAFRWNRCVGSIP